MYQKAKETNSGSGITPYNQIGHSFRNIQLFRSIPYASIQQITVDLFRSFKYWRIFTVASFNALPSASLEGRYHHVPLPQQLCLCHPEKIESIGHVLLHCLFDNDIQSQYIFPILSTLPGRPEQFLSLSL